MIITKERTRLIFSDYTEPEKRFLEDRVASMDNIFMYDDKDKHVLALPTGMEQSVKKMFPKATFKDQSDKYWPFSRIEPVQHDAKPRNQLQIDSINFILEQSNKKQKLACILSPGVGKTFLSCYCSIKVGMRTLIIAPTSAIKQQWADTLTGMFNVPKERVLLVKNPSQFVKVNADFVVISQASLAVLNNNYDLERIIKDNKFGIKVVDEVQMWFKNIINVDANSNIANNWYITGTFGRSGDAENKLYQEMFGDLAIFREKEKKPTFFNRKPGNIYGMKPHMHTKMIWTHSGLSEEEIKSVTNSMRYSEREGKWMRFGISVPKYMNLVIPPDGKMTKFLRTILNVVKQAESEVKYGKTLVLGNTISSSEIIASYLRKMFPKKKIYTYHSKHSKDENERAKVEADIIVSTTQSAGTGFDWKGLAKLVVFSQYKSWILADQISGRLRRRDDKKDTYMWDIVDADIKQLRVWANVRADVEKRKSKSFKVVDM